MREIFSRIFCVLHLKLKKWQRSDNTFSSNFVKVEMAKPYYLDKALRIKVLSYPSLLNSSQPIMPIFYLHLQYEPQNDSSSGLPFLQFGQGVT